MSAYQGKDGTGGCYSTDPNDKRVKSDSYLVPSGWRVLRRGEIVTREPVMREVKTPWKNTGCMALKQEGRTDRECVGCVHESR